MQNESENELKYKCLSIEIQLMWNIECFVIPVITGATEIVTEGLKIQYQETLDSSCSNDSCTREIAHK
jgi:hypothetical protein